MSAAIVTAVVGQVIISTGRPTFRLSNFFSYFTIESNVIAAVVLAVAGARLISGRSTSGMTFVRGAATLYMTITGIVYNALLRGLEESLNTATPWVNEILHLWAPLFVLADFLIDRRTELLSFGRALWWLIFPLLYLPYSLLRGAIVDWYPYPFLDPRPSGYLHVLPYAIAIAVLAAGLTWVLVWTTRLGRRTAGPPAGRERSFRTDR